MAARTIMHRFARWHIWLGWAAAIPLLVWTASGLFMALRPIDEVRGEELRRTPAPLLATGLTAPPLTGPVTRLMLVSELSPVSAPVVVMYLGAAFVFLLARMTLGLSVLCLASMMFAPRLCA